LSQQSIYFKRYFTDTKQSHDIEMNIEDLEFELILLYVYGKPIKITQKNYTPLLITADKYGCSEIRSKIFEFIQQGEMTGKDLIDLYNFATSLNIVGLLPCVSNIFETHPEYLLQSHHHMHFETLSLASLNEILLCTFVHSEKELLDLVEKWIQKNQKKGETLFIKNFQDKIFFEDMEAHELLGISLIDENAKLQAFKKMSLKKDPKYYGDKIKGRVDNVKRGRIYP